jgi:putative oxidoreductase
MSFLAELHHFRDVALLVLRIGLGTIFLTHGLAKRGTWKLQASQQMPAAMLRTLRLLSIAEPLGAVAVLLGLFTQIAALGLVLVMLGALELLIGKMNRPFTTPTGAGWEFEFLLLLVALSLVMTGGGRYALDRVIFGL